MSDSRTAPDTVATPEGDNEFPADQPLTDIPAGAEQTPGGSAPDHYRQPKNRANDD